MTISALMGAVLVGVMLAGVDFLHMKAHVAASADLLAALVIAFLLTACPLASPAIQHSLAA